MADRHKEISEACEQNDNLNRFIKRDLQKYLAFNKQNVSGNKCDLIERVKGTFRLNLPDVATLASNDEENRCIQQKERFTTPGGEVIPKPETINNWVSDLGRVPLPEFTTKDIYNYIVLKMKAKKQLKSKVFYEDGHVHNLEVNLLDENTSHLYIRASVLPSFPTADKKKSPDYHPWILISKVTGCIHSAACNCPAGDGECCNHIGALLYAVKDLSDKHKDGKLSSTSQKCKWSVPALVPRKRKLTPKKSQHVTFKKHKFEACLRKPVSGLQHEKSGLQTSCTANIERFRERLLSTGQNVGWLLNFPMPKKPEPELPKLYDVGFLYADTKDLRDPDCVETFNRHVDSLAMTTDECQTIETLTRGQNTSLWKEARKERLTSSNFGHICKRKPDTQPDNLLKAMLYAEFSNASTRYGQKHEKVARKMYTRRAQQTHKGLSVKESGLIISGKQPYLGASPDGLVYCPHCEEDGHGVLEIKCPASLKWRMSTPEECARDKQFFCELDDGSIKLKRTHNYYFQVQGQMGVSGRKWCDFVVWTCVGLATERIYFDELLWKEMSGKLEAFYSRCFVPELFSRRVERNLPLFK